MSYNGLFNDNGLTAILEADDIHTVDYISPFIRAIVNRY